MKRDGSMNTMMDSVVCSYQGHTAWVSTLAWSPDSTRIVSGSGDTTAQVWDARTGGHIITYREHTDSVNAVSWSPDGQSIASGGNENYAHVWDVQTGKTR